MKEFLQGLLQKKEEPQLDEKAMLIKALEEFIDDLDGMSAQKPEGGMEEAQHEEMGGMETPSQEHEKFDLDEIMRRAGRNQRRDEPAIEVGVLKAEASPFKSKFKK